MAGHHTEMPPPAEVAAEQDMFLAERGLMAPPEHVATRSAGSLISEADVAYWHEHGYLRVPGVFGADELVALEEDFEWLVADWASDGAGWQGPWRKVASPLLRVVACLRYVLLLTLPPRPRLPLLSVPLTFLSRCLKVLMDEQTEQKSKLVAMHDLHHYSDNWMKAITKPAVGEFIGRLIGPNVEVHHSTMHIKPSETGHPFPMHQDQPFCKKKTYKINTEHHFITSLSSRWKNRSTLSCAAPPHSTHAALSRLRALALRASVLILRGSFSDAHEDLRYACALIHLDDTCHENGEIRFLDGSHRNGYIKHITAADDGVSTPHLPTDKFKHADTSAVPVRGCAAFQKRPPARADVLAAVRCSQLVSAHGVCERENALVRLRVRGKTAALGLGSHRVTLLLAGKARGHRDVQLVSLRSRLRSRLYSTCQWPGKQADGPARCRCTVHGSYINQTASDRRMVRVCHRDPY